MKDKFHDLSFLHRDHPTSDQQKVLKDMVAYIFALH